MTTIGKLFLFLNLALSLVFASWAIGLATQQVNWRDPESVIDGERVKHKEIFPRLVTARDNADQRYYAALADVRALEKQIPADRVRYAQELQTMRSGMDAKGQEVREPVRRLDAKGAPGAPLQNRGNTLQSVESYKQEFSRLEKEIDQVSKEVVKLVDREKELTIQLNGEDNKGGLRAKLRFEEDEQKNSALEYEFLQPQVFNRMAEAQVLLRRQSSLQARLKELQNLGTATGRR